MFSAFVITGCSNDESGIELTKTDGIMSILGVEVELKENTLSLYSESDLQNLVSRLKTNKSVSTRLKGVDKYSDNSDVPIGIEGFNSLYDLYEDAMNEAESYYDREGGYEEFKEKYASLYFPEYGDDYSAYLPVSDRFLSKLLNRKGEIIINDEIVDMRNISHYEQLRELGLTPPEDIVILPDVDDLSNTRSGTVYFPGMPYTLSPGKAVKKNKRKIWVSQIDVYVDDNGRTKTGYDICFRKKGFLGAWYNHTAITRTYAHIGPKASRVVDNGYSHGYSSHDHRFFLVNGVEVSTPTNTPGYFQKDVYGEAQVYYDALSDYTFIIPLHYRFFRWW